MRPGAQSALVLLLLIALALGAGFAGGFVYAHDPRPDGIEVRIGASGRAAAESFIAGTLTSVDGARLELRTEGGSATIDLPPETPLEELLPATAEEMAIGSPANLGGNLTGEGPVLTGVVAFEPREDAP